MLILLAIPVALNIHTSWRLLSNDELSTTEKNAPARLVWLIPLLGSLLVLYFLNDADISDPLSKPPFVGGASENVGGQ